VHASASQCSLEKQAAPDPAPAFASPPLPWRAGSEFATAPAAHRFGAAGNPAAAGWRSRAAPRTFPGGLPVGRASGPPIRESVPAMLRRAALRCASLAFSPMRPKFTLCSITWASPPPLPKWLPHVARRCRTRPPSRRPTGLTPQNPCPSSYSICAWAASPRLSPAWPEPLPLAALDKIPSLA
jgi:hypothetical protein